METTIIVALITGAVTLVGVLFSRRGSREATAQAARATQLREREIDWQRRGDIIEDQGAELARLRDVKTRIQIGCAQAQSNSIHTIELLQSVLRDEVAREISRQQIQETKNHVESHEL